MQAGQRVDPARHRRGDVDAQVVLLKHAHEGAVEAEVEEDQVAAVVVATTITEILRNVINIQSHLNLDGIFFTNFVR
jgi:hypothetical protein